MFYCKLSDLQANVALHNVLKLFCILMILFEIRDIDLQTDHN